MSNFDLKLSISALTSQSQMYYLRVIFSQGWVIVEIFIVYS